MPEIIHSTEMLPEGPWLISRDHLLELDKLVDAEWQKLVRHHDSLVEKEVEEDLAERTKRFTKEERSDFDKKAARKQLTERVSERHAYKKRRTLVIHLDGDRRASASSFEEALRDPALLNEKPIGFTLNLRAADIECALKVPVYRRSLQLEVAPDRHPVAKGLYAALKSWVDGAKPPFWQTVWLRIQSGGGQWFVWFLSLFAILFYFSTFAPDTSAASRAARHSEAATLLKSGVTATNQFKALELILSYESGAIPNSRTFSVPSWFWWLLCGGPFFCVAIGFVPKVVLGIGRGEESIKNWNKWMKIVGITFPLWVIGTFIWPKIQHWLTNLF